MKEPKLIEYHVHVLADEEKNTLTVYAPNKRQAGLSAIKLARRLLDARIVEVESVEQTKYKPLV